MKSRLELLFVLLWAIVFALLFLDQGIGMNLLLFETPLLLYVVFYQQEKLKSTLSKMLFVCAVVSLIGIVTSHSTLALPTHILCTTAFLGSSVSSKINTVLVATINGIFNYLLSALKYANNKLQGSKLSGRKGKLSKTLMVVLTSGIILTFLLLYESSNPIFESLNNRFWHNLNWGFTKVADLVDLKFMGFVLLGFSLIAFVISRKGKAHLENDQSDDLTRRKGALKPRNLYSSLPFTLKLSLVSLLLLNAILALVNITDIYYVWFQFEWAGSYLKDFVHDGTHKLIVSILLAIAVTLFYFNQYLHFYSKNTWHKRLAYLFLGQNAILCISLFVRNNLYVKYFSLAYGRIGVYVFLLLTLYGLYTVAMKLKHNKSLFYLWRTNSAALVVVITACSLVPWDIVIAKYNFNHRDTAFLHLDYLIELSPKALPYIDLDIATLEANIAERDSVFTFRETFMPPQTYKETLSERIETFMQNWNERDWRSWNLAEQIAYEKLEEKMSVQAFVP